MLDLTVKLAIITNEQGKELPLFSKYSVSMEEPVQYLTLVENAINAFTNVLLPHMNVVAVDNALAIVKDVVEPDCVREEVIQIMGSEAIAALCNCTWIDKVKEIETKAITHTVYYTATECMPISSLNEVFSDMVNNANKNNNIKGNVKMEEVKKDAVKEAVQEGVKDANALPKSSLRAILANVDKKPLHDVISQIIAHLKLASLDVEKKADVNYKVLINKLVDYRANLRDAMNDEKSEEKVKFLQKIGYAILIGFAKTAEIILGIAKFGIDIVAILGMFTVGVAKALWKESYIAGYRIGTSFNNNIVSLFTETEFRSIIDIK